MARFAKIGRWEIIHGRLWPMGDALEVGLMSAFEGRRFKHFGPTEAMQVPSWVLDYHFDTRMRVQTQPPVWHNRTPGTWHLYPPQQNWFQDTRRSSLPLHALWIRFHGAEKLGLRQLLHPRQHMARIHDPGGWLVEKIRAMAMAGDTQIDKAYSEMMVGLMDVIHHLLQSRQLAPGEYTLDGPGDGRPQDPLINRINEYLVAHLHEPVRLAELARAMHTSISTLHRRYALTSGESITQTLIRLRISRVKQLLMEGQTASEAYQQTGFFDPAHLTRTFRRLEGIPPGEFVSRLKNLSSRRTRKPKP